MYVNAYVCISRNTNQGDWELTVYKNLGSSDARGDFNIFGCNVEVKTMHCIVVTRQRAMAVFRNMGVLDSSSEFEITKKKSY